MIETLSERLDTTISSYIDTLPTEYEGTTPIPLIIMGAVSNIIIKLAMFANIDRKFILDIFDDLIPSDDVLQRMREEENSNVISLNNRRMH